MKIYKIEIITQEPSKFEKKNIKDSNLISSPESKSESFQDSYDIEEYRINIDEKNKINIYNKVEKEIIKIFFPHES